MQLPLSLWDINLWLAVTAIILLITSEIISPRSGQSGLLIDKKRLRSVAIILGAACVCTIILQIYFLITR